MTLLAIALILSSATLHATWNLLAKRAGGGAAFVWLFAALSSVIYAPIALAVLLIQHPHIGANELLLIVGSGLLHVIYFLLLQRGYQVGDLSLVYPLARGTGPLLSTTAAILFLGEHPTPIALTGAVLIGIGTFALTGSSQPLQTHQSRGAIAYGILTGTLIAAYTLWDEQGVSTLMIPPLLMDYGSNFSRVLFLTPIALHQWETVCTEWNTHRREILGIACLSPLSYILFLTALAFTPISYVAPLREISILIGVFFGTKLLAEGSASYRLIAAAVMVLGAIALAIG